MGARRGVLRALIGMAFLAGSHALPALADSSPFSAGDWPGDDSPFSSRPAPAATPKAPRPAEAPSPEALAPTPAPIQPVEQARPQAPVPPAPLARPRRELLPPPPAQPLESAELPQPMPRVPAIDLTAEPPEIWERIRNGFALRDLDDPLVNYHEEWYASRPDYLKRVVDRAGRYLYHIVDEVERRGMPAEIALLPVIESAFNPRALSRSNAAGLWQFIPSTGKNYGLRQDWWYDGRRDVVAATEAALDYLENLYEMFGSWHLALAAYNCGEGTVSRAIARNQALGLPTDYRSLNLPAETRNYVPKLQAVKNIVATPGAFGIDLPPVPNDPYFTVVRTPRSIDTHLAARLAGVSLEEFKDLNPAHNRPIIRQDAQLVLPLDKAEAFVAKLKDRSAPLSAWQTYQSRRGERLERIAARFHMSVSALREANGIASRRRTANGETLMVMASAAATAPEREAPAKPREAQRAPRSGGHTVHVVASGDTLFGLARRYGVSPQDIQRDNKLKGTRLARGQKLTIARADAPAAEPARPAVHAAAADREESPKAALRATVYTVARGDTLYSIARRFGVSVEAVHRWNGLGEDVVLIPGDRLTLYPGQTS